MHVKYSHIQVRIEPGSRDPEPNAFDHSAVLSNESIIWVRAIGSLVQQLGFTKAESIRNTLTSGSKCVLKGASVF